MKTCIKHPLVELKTSGKRQREKCSECNKEYQAKWWQKNKALQRSRVKANSKKAKARSKDLINGHLQSHPCVDCGESDIEVLEFDHLKDKTMNVSAMPRAGFALEKIKEEIAKCEVRCANCHRRKTRKQFGYTRV